MGMRWRPSSSTRTKRCTRRRKTDEIASRSTAASRRRRRSVLYLGSTQVSVLKKNFVLDTNVLLHDPGSIYAFEENNVIIPIYVIEEIDKFKRDLSELGRSAREVSRSLDELRADGNISEGVDLDGGGSLRVAFTAKRIPEEALQDRHTIDNKILAVALDVKEHDPHGRTIMVTKDVNLRLRADALGLDAEDYDHDRVEITELYTGVMELELAGDEIDLF